MISTIKRNRYAKSNRIDCLKCGKSVEYCKTINQLRRHVATIHLNDPIMFSCRQCSFTSNSYRKNIILTHIRRNHRSSDESLIDDHREKHHDALIVGVRECFRIDSERFQNRKTEKSIKCKKCDKQLNFKNYRSYAAHAHMHLGISPIRCRLCAYKTRHMYDIRMHLRLTHQSRDAVEYVDDRGKYGTMTKFELRACFGDDVYEFD